MSMMFEEITKALPTLARNDLEQIKSRISFLIKTSKPSAKTEANEELFYSVARDVLLSMKFNAPYFGIFKKTNGYTSYPKRLEVLDNFIDKVIGKVDRTKRMRLYRLFTLLVVEDLKERGKVIQLPIVLNSLHMVPALVERSFPGYIEAGFVHMLLDKWATNSPD